MNCNTNKIADKTESHLDSSRSGDQTQSISGESEYFTEELLNEQELCAVICFHPDVSRIGECCSVSASQPQLTFGRSTPAFATFGGNEPQGIGDSFVSRDAFTLHCNDSSWCLTREQGRSRLRIDGQELRSSLSISSELLQQGVVLTLAERVVLHLRLQARSMYATPMPDVLRSLTGVSPAMRQLRDATVLAAKSSEDVLLVGPTGTGKERIAQAIHALSDRSEAPWVAVNIAALPTELASASLFGARKGAFTGADQHSLGYFQQADGGTLFLDEIGDAASSLQPMLLRALQEREVQIVGGKIERVDLRVIAAMEHDPDRHQDHFRPALRYRLGAQEIRLPRLAERREDISLIAAELFADRMGEHFFDRSSDRGGVSQKSPDRERIDAEIGAWARLFELFLAYAWPGNIRELQHTVAQICSHSETGLRVPAVVRDRIAPSPQVSSQVPVIETQDRNPDDEVKEGPAGRMSDVSDEAFIAAWQHARYEVSTAAKALGVSRSAVYRRLQNLRECRLAADVPLGEMLAALDACYGDLASTADRLGVSHRGLQTRLRASGMSPAKLPELLDR